MAATPKPMRKKLREGTNIARKKRTQMNRININVPSKEKDQWNHIQVQVKNLMKMIKEVY